MFNIGGGEVLVILLVALIVLGPERLPGVVRQAGQFMGEIRKMSSGFQEEVRGAFDEVERASTNSSAKTTDAEPASGTMASEPDAPADTPDGSAAPAHEQPALEMPDQSNEEPPAVT